MQYVIDYRDELDFRIALVITLVKNFSENRNGKKLLSVEKLRLLILICLTPKKLNKVSISLNKKSINNLQNIFYNDSLSNLDASELREISLLIAYMCKAEYLQIAHESSKFIIIGQEAANFAESISDSAPLYLSRNFKLIKLISGKSESQITKALLEI